MNNNDRLTRLRYALDIRDNDMVEIFNLGGMTISKEDVQALFKRISNEDSEENEYAKVCTNEMFERFLNGLISSQRGVKDGGQPELELHDHNANNLLLKKVKIALSLTSDDILDILDESGIYVSNSELSAVLRKEGHRNYKPCGDRYVRNFLQGLTLRYRAED